MEVAAYRIVQEAVTNVLKHAGASNCAVDVRGENGALVVTVADDGTGLARRGAGAGLDTMRERAEELGGSLARPPRDGGGTVVRAVLPREPGVTPIRVLVVDDHPLFRAGVAALLDSVDDTEVVATAADGDAAVREATLTRPDVVLMDLALPGTSGLEATRRIVAACPDRAVLVLSMLEDDASVVSAMRAGARGYVLKGAGQEELLAAVRAVAAGGAVFGASVAARLLAGLDEPTPSPPSPG